MNKYWQAAVILAAAICSGPLASAATVTVPLTAQRATASLPDGSLVPMWGYCASANTSNVTGGAVCPPATPTIPPLWAAGPTITVAGGDTLTITLSNLLPVPTSIVILGQQGDKLGQSLTRLQGPDHSLAPQNQDTTWPAGSGATPTLKFSPPAQSARAVSFATETASGKSLDYTWVGLKPGTYIYETGSKPSLQAPMGLYGVLVVTAAPTFASPGPPAVAFAPGAAYPAYTDAAGIAHTPVTTLPYDADAVMLFSEIDPVQNAAVEAATSSPAAVTAGHTGGGAWEMQPWSSPSCAPCYPPAVNYSPRFFLINGQAFNPTAPQSLAIPGDVSSGNVLLRFANAGLRTHVPTVTGTSVLLMAEDGNLAPGLAPSLPNFNAKVQTELLLTAGKTYDVVLQPAQSGTPATYAAATVSVFDRALHLTTNNAPMGGMQALIRINGQGAANGAAGGVPTAFAARAVDDVFAIPVSTTPFTGNLLANDFGVVSVTAVTAIGTPFTVNADGTFTFTPATAGLYTFTYQGVDGAGNTIATAANVTINVGSSGTITANADSYDNTTLPKVSSSSIFTAAAPGVLANDSDSTKHPLSAVLDSAGTCMDGNGNPFVDLKLNGAFTAAPAAGANSCSFTYRAVNSLGMRSDPATTVTITFPFHVGFPVAVLDTQTRKPILNGDYSWVIEEDLSFQHSGDPAVGGKATNTLATNFHKSHMPLVAAGCTGPRSCGDSNSVNGVKISHARSLPGDVVLDFNPRTAGGATRQYYLSVVPADASDGAPADPANNVAAVIGHGMGGAQILSATTPVTVLTPQNPLPVANLSVFVFEDNSPTNGDVDEGEPGLGGFQVNIFDVRGSSGDAAGQMTYDLAGMPLTNGLIGKPGCPSDDAKVLGKTDSPLTVGTIYTCPNAPIRKRSDYAPGRVGATAYQARIAQDAIDYKLAGMALIPNMIPGRFTVEAIPNAARTIGGEKWVQVSTLEGGKPVDTFIKAGEPAYWQEFGSPGFHSFIGFMNPAHVKVTQAQLGGKETLTGVISSLHMDRPPAARLNDSCNAASGPADAACRAALSYTTCYVSVNTGIAGTGQNVSYSECDAAGNFTLYNVPTGDNEIVIWDQWLDQIIAKKQLLVKDTGGSATQDIGHIPVFSWFTRVEQSAYIDLNKNGVRDPGEPGIAKVPMNIRFRDGSISNFLSTDGDGVASANELFPLFNWYVVESDTTRYKGTGVNVVYDAGGKPDNGPVPSNTANPGYIKTLKADVKKDYSGVLNSTEKYPATPVPGAVYTPGTTVRVDPGTTLTEGLQGFVNQTAIIDWGKTPYALNENGGINGLVFYASTRGFDDPRLEVQFSWEPAIPRVPVNLYAEITNADGTMSYLKIDSTTTSSWDDTAAGISCPGQAPDLFVTVALGGSASKCYDGQHVFNQVQPAQYDGRYQFPSASPLDASYLVNGMLKPGKYVVEVVPPAGYEIVKEEDKNILIGEPWNPLGSTQFLGLGNIFILPDTATLNDANVSGARLALPACVGAMHTVTDFLTLFPDNQQYSPFAGQNRPLCDRKEVVLNDQTQVNANFQLFTPTPVAAHFVGMMLNDAAAEFDPVSPSFGEKAALPNAPISIRDFNGVEILRTYNDKWGTFNGMTPSTLAVNVPNPSGYSPNMLTTCMNDPGPILDTRVGSNTNGQMIIDPAYNPMFSNFCYAWPFMPGSTVYLDTPVLPTAAYASASSYQPVDCQYPDQTPAIKRVDGPAKQGPWIMSSATGAQRNLTITALGDADVLNPAYAGPTSIDPTTQLPKIKRHYGFGTKGTVSLRRTGSGISSTPTPMSVVGTWGDTLTVTVPAEFNAGDSGELIITNGDSGQTSVDTVTVSIEATAPTFVRPVTTLVVADPTAPDSLNYPQPIQKAIDAAKPGDLIILDAGSYPELVVMWKPVRLQGVGAASVFINATKFPNRKVADWRGRINALFGVDPIADTLDPNAQVSPLPGQTLTGGIVLLEPTVLSTEEGAGITVLASDTTGIGNLCPRSFTGTGPVITVDASGATTPDTVPLTLLTKNDARWSNFTCAASRIDGVSVTGGDAGGGIYVNGWAHNLQIANNRVFGNAGPFSGGVRIGQPYLEGAVNTGVLDNGTVLGYNRNINIHHNAITTNGMVEGNAAAGATAAGGAGGGLSICSGTDNYKVNYNFICGNFASSDGGGIGHIGLSNKGSIAFNQILFNESYNQTSPQNGGGLVVEGETGAAAGVSPGSGDVTIDANIIQGNFARAGNGGGLRLQDTNGDDLLCSIGNGAACPDQSRPWLVTVTNNIIVNNLSGASGGGVSLFDSFGAVFNNNTIASNDSTGIVGGLFNTVVNGTSTGPVTGVPSPAGISTDSTSAQLLAALPVRQRATYLVSTPVLVNNIIWQNRSFFFDATRLDPVSKLGASIVASNQWTDATSGGGAVLGQTTIAGQCVSGAAYWDVGVTGDQLPLAPVALLFTVASASHPTTGTNANRRTITVTTTAANGLTAGDYVTVSGFAGTSSGYNVALAPVQSVTSASTFTYQVNAVPVAAAAGAGGTVTKPARGLHPTNSVLTPETLTLYSGQGNLSGGPSSAALFTKQYCNGSRVLPGVQFEPGTPFQPNFQLNAAATLDESGNFVDLHFGPISLGDPKTGVIVGNYHLPNQSAPGYNRAVATPANGHDVDNDVRPRTGVTGPATGIDIGADQFVPLSIGVPGAGLTPSPLAFGSQFVNTTSNVQTLQYANTGTTPLTVATVALGGANPGNFSINAAGSTCAGATLAPGASCTIGVTFTPGTASARTATVTVTDTVGGAAAQTATLTGTGTVPAAAGFTGQGVTTAGNGTVAMAWAANGGQRILTLTNTGAPGAGPLTLISVPAITQTGSQYTVVAAGTTCAAGTVLNRNQSCTVAITRARPAAAPRAGTATLTFTDTGAVTVTQAVTLNGA